MGQVLRGQQGAAMAAFVAIVAAYPLIFSNAYLIGVGIAAGAMAAGTVGFVLLIGYAHQLALGQAAFCIVGGYVSALATTRWGWDPLVALIAGALLAMLLAYAIGKPILKLRGFILAMASLALQLLLIAVLQEQEYTGKALGIPGVPKFGVFGIRLDSDLAFYYVTWAFVLAAIVVGLNINASRVGRALKAIASSEMAASSVGIDVTRHKVQMFVISAGMASISGSLTVHYLRVMGPHIFDFAYSLNIVTAVIAGGLMSIWGGALGASIFIAIREIVRNAGIPYLESIVMGVLTCFVLIAFPRGFAGLVAGAARRLAGAPAASAAAGASPAPRVEAEAAPAAGALTLSGVSKSFGNLRAVSDVGFAAPAGEIMALIGPNGAGKTTLFNLVCGFQPLDGGAVAFAGRDIGTLLPNEIAALGIGRTFQNLQLFGNLTVLENVMCGAHRHTAAGILEVSARLPSVGREEAATRARALECLRFVGLEAAAGRYPSELPFGHQRLVEIARALALKPALLLMDEPASGLNDTETERLADLILAINRLGVTILLIEHDIRLVMGVADHVVVLHHGEKIAEGPPDEVRRDPQVVSAYLGQ